MKLLNTRKPKNYISNCKVQFNLYALKIRKYCRFNNLDLNLVALKYETLIFRRLPYFIFNIFGTGALYTLIFVTLPSFIMTPYGATVNRRRNITNENNTSMPHAEVDSILVNSLLIVSSSTFLLIVVILLMLCCRSCVETFHNNIQAAVMNDNIAYLYENHKNILENNALIEVKTLWCFQSRQYPIMQIVGLCEAKNIKKTMLFDSNLGYLIHLLNNICKTATTRNLCLPDDLCRHIISFLDIDDVYPKELNTYGYRSIFCCPKIIVTTDHQDAFKFDKLWKLSYESHKYKNIPLVKQFDNYLHNRDKFIQKSISDNDDIEKQLFSITPSKLQLGLNL